MIHRRFLAHVFIWQPFVLNSCDPRGTEIVLERAIDESIKNEAAAVLGAVSFTVSDALRLMMMRIVEKIIPFDPLAPMPEPPKR